MKEQQEKGEWKLGDTCYVKYHCFPLYDEYGNRELVFENLKEPIQCIVIGKTRVCTGKYVKSRGYTDFESYEQASLQVRNRHLVYQVKFDLSSKILTVLHHMLHRSSEAAAKEKLFERLQNEYPKGIKVN